jgi:hypothetical protein
MPPITQDERIGVELLNVVPFENWEGLYYSIDRGNEEGGWEEVYMNSRGYNRVRTPVQVQIDVIKKTRHGTDRSIRGSER